LRGYDKYHRRYDKAAIPESTFPDQFYLLRRDELGTGIEKAGKLLHRLGHDGDRLIVMKSNVAADELYPNTRTGLGRFVRRSWISVDNVFFLHQNDDLHEQLIEDVCAMSFAAISKDLHPLTNLFPDRYPCCLKQSVARRPIRSVFPKRPFRSNREFKNCRLNERVSPCDGECDRQPSV